MGTGANTKKILALLEQFESRNILWRSPERDWPIVWKRASGCSVWDAEGKKYLDLTAAFGVAATGHSNPAVVRAMAKQSRELLHAMGDVHPHAQKAFLAQALSELTFERWKAGPGKSIFGNSGFEAVEAALKTALLATGRPGVIVFSGGYHGLGYGALNATDRLHFRGPFIPQLKSFGFFAPFPEDPPSLEKTERVLRKLFAQKKIGALLVEPVQGRGGIRIPPKSFLPLLRQLCDQYQAAFIVDEIFTGFGRTGAWFACERTGVVPDLICLGKALTGGFPLSACVGKASWMDAAWPPSTGEAIHTSTFLGHPVGCAMALAQISELKRRDLPNRSARLGVFLLEQLGQCSQNVKYPTQIRGLGLMAGLELRTKEGRPATALCLKIARQMLHRGFILLPEGEAGNVLSFTPPLIISKEELKRSVGCLQECLGQQNQGP